MVKIELTKGRRNIILVLFLFGLFIGSLDAGIIGPALQSIQGTFNIDSRLSSWVYTTYVLFFIVGSPIVAKLSDFKGKRNIYILSIAIFAIGSGLIAFSHVFELVILGRALQGFSAGGLFPLAAAFIGDYFPVEKRGTALGSLGSVYGMGAICGPVLGAIILPFGWEWLFLINIPIAICLILGSFLFIPIFEQNKEFNVDWLGIGLFSIAVSSLAFGLNRIDSSKFFESLFSFEVLPFILLFIILLPILFKIEKKSKEPLLPIELLKIKEMLVASCISLCFGMMVSIYVFLPSLALLIFFNDNSIASLIMLPIVLTSTIAAPIVGILLDRLGSKKIMVTGTISLLFGIIIMVFFFKIFYLFIFAEVFISFGLFTIVGAPIRYIVLTETKKGQRGSGQATVNILSNVGQLIGGALIGAIIASFSGKVIGYNISFVFIFIFAIISFLLAIQLKNRKEQLKTVELNNR
ncbi:MAG: MFS transporter [Methanobrevibacter sp.]|jgi:MFS family permease|nr:MFS transporter [Candidatus Methanoflexus mossambicus]